MKRTELSPGLIYVYTGSGKGKTSAALGQVVRALGFGWRVAWVAWYKESSWRAGEFSFAEGLSNAWRTRFEMYLLGRGFYIKKPTAELQTSEKKIKVAAVGDSGQVIDDDAPSAHASAALAALAKATALLKRRARRPNILILDEICNAVDDGLLPIDDVLALLAARAGTHLVLTGRNAHPKIVEAADLVSTITKTKHPYDLGKLAVPGLDF